MSDWYYHDAGEGRVGPLSADELRRRFQQRRIQRETLVWREGMREWQPLAQAGGEIDLGSVVQDMSMPPPLPSAPAYAAAAASASPVSAMSARPPGAAHARPQKKGMSGCLIAVLVCAGLAVPMIGILAAIALPAYQDYTVRARVMQTINETAPLQAAIAGHFAAYGTCPDTGSAPVAAIVQQLEQGAYTQSVRVGTIEEGRCAFELTLRGTRSSSDGKTILFVAQGNEGTSAWDCTGGDLPAIQRPRQCRPTQ